MKFEPSIPASSSQGFTPITARFTLDQPPFAGEPFAAVFRTCQNPCCPCRIVGFECRAAATPDVVLRFDVDAVSRELVTGPNSKSADAALGRAFLHEADESHWVWLRDLFLATKRRMMETMDLDTIDARFPDFVLAGEGTLVGYHEVFPWADTLKCNLGGSEWLVDDQHCVRPGCDCTEDSLAFHRLPPPDDQPIAPLRPVAVVCFDRCSGRMTVREKRRDSPKPRLLVNALRAAVPNLAERLRHRHEHLKRLGKRLLPQATYSLEAGTPRPVLRVGRNDPCPCGSGKKFKKCCGGA